MDSLIHADIFFFVATIAVVLLSVLLIIVIYYLHQTLRNFRDISRMLKNGVENAGDKIEGVMEDVEDSMIYKFIFGKKTKKTKHKK